MTVAAIAGSVGMLGLAARGFTTPLGGGVLEGPTPWAVLIVVSLLLARSRFSVRVRG